MIELTKKEREFLVKEIASSEEWEISKVKEMIREHELQHDFQNMRTLVGWLENINYRRKNVYGL